jgi:hypothetical protein
VGVEDALVARYDHHTEFVLGIDFNLMVDGKIADCSWDESVSVYQLTKTTNNSARAAPTLQKLPPPGPGAAAGAMNSAAGTPFALNQKTAEPALASGAAPPASLLSGAIASMAGSLAAAAPPAVASAAGLAPPPLAKGPPKA